MKKVYFVIAALLMLTACSFGEKSQKTAEDTDGCKEFTGVIARERYANSAYATVSRKYVLFEDGKTMMFCEPSPELVLAEPGDTLVYRTSGKCLEVRFK